MKILDIEDYQSVYTSEQTINYSPGQDITLDISYTTSNLTYELSKLGLRIHYDSSFLTLDESKNGEKFELISPPEFINNNDFQNYDDNPDTDKFILIKWAGNDNKLPEGDLPIKIGQLFFHTSTDKIDSLTGESNSTIVNFTAESTGENFDFLSSSTILKPLTFNLDVDGNGKVTALGDGVMIIRKLFGAAFAGEKLTANATTNSTTRTTEEIHDYISSMTEISTLI